MTKSSRIYFSFVQAIQVIKKTRSALIRALLVLLFMQTKGKCMYTFYIMRFFEKTHISVYDGSLKGLCKMIELILGKKLEPNHLQNVLARTNVSRLGLQYIKKNRNKILLIYIRASNVSTKWRQRCIMKIGAKIRQAGRCFAGCREGKTVTARKIQ